MAVKGPNAKSRPFGDPVHLCFDAPGVTLRHAGLAHQHCQRDLALVDILPNRPLADFAIWQLVLNPLPDAVGRMPLLARRLAIGFQHRIDELGGCFQFPAWPFSLLPRLRQRTSNRLAHHPPMHTQLLGHPGNRSDAELVLSTDLLK